VSTDSISGATVAGRYTIRPYEPDDLDGFLRLDQRIWDRTRTPEWFRWKYVDNPYVDHIPVFVAEHDDEIVGVRPFLAFELRVGENSVTAYQPADTMVHPDHRREGLFREMTTHALSTYRDREPTLFFNFPNEHARPGYLDLGWRTVAPRVTYYRIDSPAALPTGMALSTAIQPFLRAYYAVQQSVSSPPAGLIVRQVDGAAIGRLAALHDECRTPKIHADRTETFLDWRLSSPIWDRRMYFVHEEAGSDPVAGLVSRSRTTSEGMRLTQVVDVAPLSGGQRWQNAVWEGLRAVVATHPETDLFAVSNGGIPHEILTAVGFLSDDSLPISQFTSFDPMLVARPNDDPADESAWQIAGHAVDDADNWCVTFAERDTS